jgi:hypothetical protein
MGVPGESDAVVTVPSGGLTKTITPTDFVSSQYQILVENTSGPVNISNLAVDGTGGGGSAGTYVVGIFYVDSTGTVDHVSARNQPDFGTGIMALTSAAQAQTVTVQNSVVRGLAGGNSFGIVAYGGAGVLTANIRGNTIRNSNNFKPAGFGSGIQFYKATGKVESNAISGTANGLQFINSSATAIGNTISTLSVGILLLSGSNTIKRNDIDAGGATGMSLGYEGTNSIVQGNAITNSSTAVFGCDGNGFSSGFTVTGNTITDATVGMQMPSPTSNITAPNKYYATATAVAPQPCFYSEE